MIDTNTIRIYQPIPFDGYDNMPPTRSDCAKRYDVIQNEINNVDGNTLLDLCCANGYFMFKFLQDGGNRAVGVDRDKSTIRFVNDLAKEQKVDVSCFAVMGDVKGKFDYGFYLDTHMHGGTEGYVEEISDKVYVLFTSCCRGRLNNEYKQCLHGFWNNVEEIYTGYEGRAIFKCS